MPRSCGDADPPTGHVGSGQELAYHTDEVCSPWRSPWKECFPRKHPNISRGAGGTRLTFVSQSGGKKKDHTVKNVLLVNALLVILFLSDTYAGRTHDKPIADTTPYPLPAGSRLLQDLGFLAFTLPEVTILMPTKKPRGQELTLAQQRANQALNQRRLRIEHVNSSVKRCRIVKDRLRLWKQGVRDLVRELGCALHNFRVRLTPWQPMV